MAPRFDYFMICAEMRTGSNFLEENVNAIPGLRCWGEAFNPVFVGRAGSTKMAGVTMEERDADPMVLLSAMRAQSPGLAGFRYFHDHDPRIEEHCVDDPACAKIVLTRNPVDSYVSLKIARSTGQWRLGDLKQARSAKVRFDPKEFAAHLDRVRGAQERLLRRLQVTGQTAFYIGYEDLADLDVMNGLAAFLGVSGRLEKKATRTKVQNPAPLSSKVENYDEMTAALGDLDRFAISRTPNFEPRRGPNVPGYVASCDVPLLYLPVEGGPRAAVEGWLEGFGPTPLIRGQSQKELRQWKRKSPGHRSFTVVRHPIRRIHDTFCRRILMPGRACYGEIRATLRSHYGVPLPEGAPDDRYDAAAHRAAFLGFLAFVKGNLGNQTSLRVDAAWASQWMILQGMSKVQLPDMILRDDQLSQGLHQLCAQVGAEAPPVPAEEPVGPVPLDAIYDAEVEATVRDIYQRDYVMFGFRALA
ncbi:hypothetical protein SAMN04490244_105319 [Tranquillimonas rosea]|uniref:LPS sulfotransferase NodH n=1 Tax=Tranquillimonas rosea TaxID=641238 RepID=A0A1H9UKA9_9RHOB|nr:nodulation protein NodH [Tranquillimonas rosea]SES09463.1 hypothetical protein SAMN04490244_105319 [Tranquillimonas rosea]